MEGLTSLSDAIVRALNFAYPLVYLALQKSQPFQAPSDGRCAPQMNKSEPSLPGLNPGPGYKSDRLEMNQCTSMDRRLFN